MYIIYILLYIFIFIYLSIFLNTVKVSKHSIHGEMHKAYIHKMCLQLGFDATSIQWPPSCTPASEALTRASRQKVNRCACSNRYYDITNVKNEFFFFFSFFYIMMLAGENLKFIGFTAKTGHYAD